MSAPLRLAPHFFVVAVVVALATLLVGAIEGAPPGPRQLAAALAYVVLLTWVGHRARPGGAWMLGLAAGNALLLVVLGPRLFEDEPVLRPVLWLLFTVFCLFPFGAFVVVARDLRDAREGSLAARAERYTVASLGALPLEYLLGCLLFELDDGSLRWVFFGIVVAEKLVFLVANLTLLRKIRAEGKACTVVATREPQVSCVDLGVGETLFVRVLGETGYRTAPIVTHAVRGSVHEAAALVRRRTALTLKLAAGLLLLPPLAALVACIP